MAKFTIGVSLTLLALAMLISAAPNQPAKISVQLSQALLREPTANIFLVMADTTTRVLAPLHQTSFKNRGERVTSVANALKAHAASSQQSVLDFLRSKGSNFESLWINNQIYVKNANSALIAELAALPGISDITLEEILPLEVIAQNTITYSDSVGAPIRPFAEPGIEKVQAHLVWDTWTRGEGVVVAEMTTGVRMTHEALRDNYVGEYGWFDPEFYTNLPADYSGIGTFSTGLLVGSGGIGMAPGAKWMACRGCGEVSCSQSGLMRCGEFMACPTLPSGYFPDCSKAPNVVVNNWGGGGSAWYDHIVDAWHAADITPVFVVGINGPDCGTAGAADNVIAVGAVNLNDTLSESSSRGPSQALEIKPDLVGPGVLIRSAWNTNDTAYNLISSTTPASGIVSGTIALLKSAFPELTYEQVREFLIAGVETADLTPTGRDCGGISEEIFPNNAYGYGRVNAFKSVLAATTKLQLKLQRRHA